MENKKNIYWKVIAVSIVSLTVGAIIFSIGDIVDDSKLRKIGSIILLPGAILFCVLAFIGVFGIMLSFLSEIPSKLKILSAKKLVVYASWLYIFVCLWIPNILYIKHLMKKYQLASLEIEMIAATDQVIFILITIIPIVTIIAIAISKKEK